MTYVSTLARIARKPIWCSFAKCEATRSLSTTFVPFGPICGEEKKSNKNKAVEFLFPRLKTPWKLALWLSINRCIVEYNWTSKLYRDMRQTWSCLWRHIRLRCEDCQDQQSSKFLKLWASVLFDKVKINHQCSVAGALFRREWAKCLIDFIKQPLQDRLGDRR